MKMKPELNMNFKDEQHFKQWSMPVNTRLFKPLPWFFKLDMRDTLLYCNSPQVYCLNKIDELVRANPKEKFTVIGTGYPSLIHEIPENLLVVKSVPHTLMFIMYMRHKNV